ncbi:MAG: hypothetical protein D6751_07355 [Deltaproteobacteria bacterium]|nr:MAG: hypothetical protein D6751_07355 [Deltaproteobacteria bacterium]
MVPAILAISGVAVPPVVRYASDDIHTVQTAGAAALGPMEPPCLEPLVSLAYDGTSSWGAKAQDFENIFDIYDIFVIEDFSTQESVLIDAFASLGFGTDRPDRATDVGVRIFEDNGSGLPGESGFSGRLRLMSIPGTGFFDGQHAIASFGGQCLPAGSYFVVWAVRLNFTHSGQIFFFVQSGAYSTGEGGESDAWQWLPGDSLGLGTHFRVVDGSTGEATGVNFMLCGQAGPCDLRFCEGDWTGSSNPQNPLFGVKDGDVDADDFFFFLDIFISGDARADLTSDAVIDGDDFFAYLDLFAQGCP